MTKATLLTSIRIRLKDAGRNMSALPLAIAKIVYDINKKRIEFEADGLSQERFEQYALDTLQSELTELIGRIEICAVPAKATPELVSTEDDIILDGISATALLRQLVNRCEGVIVKTALQKAGQGGICNSLTREAREYLDKFDQ